MSGQIDIHKSVITRQRMDGEYRYRNHFMPYYAAWFLQSNAPKQLKIQALYEHCAGIVMQGNFTTNLREAIASAKLIEDAEQKTGTLISPGTIFIEFDLADETVIVFDSENP
ncbi:MAG: hypothetical protein JWO43_159 [Candidatus Adlerbacteria bacterium]|nr:hypothetical protein [Candidatus Adlerbacteria bacterium]